MEALCQAYGCYRYNHMHVWQRSRHDEEHMIQLEHYSESHGGLASPYPIAQSSRESFKNDNSIESNYVLSN